MFASFFKVFEGIPPPYDKQRRMVIPKALRVLRLKPGRKVSDHVLAMCAKYEEFRVTCMIFPNHMRATSS